jgi:hypothetical protein
MCVVLLCKPEVRPSPEILQLCAERNPHGAGIAWRSRGAVEWLKTDDLAQIKSLVHRLKGEIVIHFRIATVGGACPELRHPFPVTERVGLAAAGRAKAVLFQNGTWKLWHEAVQRAWERGHSPPIGPMSDTRAAAWLCRLYGHNFLGKCGASRWVYFSESETVRYGEWHERDGILFSNLNWLRPATREGR